MVLLFDPGSPINNSTSRLSQPSDFFLRILIASSISPVLWLVGWCQCPDPLQLLELQLLCQVMVMISSCSLSVVSSFLCMPLIYPVFPLNLSLTCLVILYMLPCSPYAANSSALAASWSMDSLLLWHVCFLTFLWVSLFISSRLSHSQRDLVCSILFLIFISLQKGF